MGELLERLKSETPKFWKKIRTGALVITTLATGVVTFGASLALPAIVILGAKVAVAVCGTLVASSSITRVPTLEEAVKIVEDSKKAVEELK